MDAKELLKSIFTSILTFESSVLDSEIDSIRKYLNDNELTLNNFQKDLDSRIEIFKKKNQGDVFERFFEEHNQYHNHYPSLFYNSTLIWLFSFFENKMIEFSINARNRFDIKLKHTDLSGKGVTQCEKYLRDVIDINLGSLSSTWARLKTYQSIRNLIVHNNSSVIKDENKPMPDQPRYQEIIELGVTIDSFDGKIKIESKLFLETLLNNIDAYLKGIIEKLREKEMEYNRNK